MPADNTGDNPLYAPQQPLSESIAEAPLPHPGGVSGRVPEDPSAGIMGGSIISGVGSLLSSGMNLYSAAQNRKWMEHMSNTAHQREVADLRAAGLNPILSATRMGGASSPQQASPTVNNPLEAVGAGVSSAAQARMTQAQMAASVESTAYQIATQRQQAHGAYLDNLGKQVELLRSGITTKQMGAEYDLTREQLLQIHAQKAKAESMAPMWKALGPVGTYLLDEFLPRLLGPGLITGPFSAISARRGQR